MKLEDIQENVIKIVCNVLENSKLSIDVSTSSEDISEWTSLRHILIISEVEKEFNINFELEDILEMTNISAISIKIYELLDANY